MTYCICIRKLIGLTKLALLYSGLPMFLTSETRNHYKNSDFCDFVSHYKAEVSKAFITTPPRRPHASNELTV